MTHNKPLFFIILISFVLFVFPQFGIVKAQQVDTVLVHNTLTSYQVVSTIDTVKLNKYLKGYVLKLSISDLKTNNFIQEIKDTSDEYWELSGINYFDINLDDFKDIKVRFTDSGGWESNSFWLYDSTHNLFFYSNEFSQLGEYSIVDRTNKIIRAYSPSYRGMIHGAEYRYKIDGANLILLEEEGWGEAVDDGNIYDIDSYYFYKKKLINGELITVELDSLIHSNNNYINKYYEFIHGSLLPTSILWAIDEVEILTDSSNYNIYYQHRFNGDTYKHYKKIIYDYDVDNEGNLLSTIKTFFVKNNKWVLVK